MGRTFLEDGELLEEGLGRNEDWAFILRIAVNQQLKTLEAIGQYAIRDLTSDSLAALKQWPRLDTSQRWILWLLLRQRFLRGILRGYVAIVLKEAVSHEHLTLAITCAVLSYKTSELKVDLSIHHCRRELLRAFGLTNLPTSFWEQLSGLTPEAQLHYLSYATEEEKCHAINLLGFVMKSSLTDIYRRNDIAELYPELHAYSSPSSWKDCWLSRYLDLVRIVKVHNTMHPDVAEMLGDWPTKRFELATRNDALRTSGEIGRASCRERV